MPKEHILVCLSSSPSNERIVRMAGKMAQAFRGSLTALYVQTPGDADMNAEDTVRLQANMRLAQQLGAEIVTTHGEDAAAQIAEYVRLSDANCPAPLAKQSFLWKKKFPSTTGSMPRSPTSCVRF